MTQNGETFSKTISKGGKKLLTNTIRTNDFHNKMIEEEVMWRQKELLESTHVKKLSSSPSSSLPYSASPKLPLPAKEKRKISNRMRGFDQPSPPKKFKRKKTADSSQRWDHDGYRELYPEEFESKEVSNKKKKKREKKKINSKEAKRIRHSSSSNSPSPSTSCKRGRPLSLSTSTSTNRHSKKSKHKRKKNLDLGADSFSDSSPSRSRKKGDSSSESSSSRSRKKNDSSSDSSPSSSRKRRDSSSSSCSSASNSSTGSSNIDQKIKKYKKRLVYLKTKQTFRHSIKTTVLKCLKKAFSKEYLKAVLELSSSSGLSSDESDADSPQPFTAALANMLTPPSSSNGRKTK